MFSAFRSLFRQSIIRLTLILSFVFLFILVVIWQFVIYQTGEQLERVQEQVLEQFVAEFPQSLDDENFQDVEFYNENTLSRKFDIDRLGSVRLREDIFEFSYDDTDYISRRFEISGEEYFAFINLDELDFTVEIIDEVFSISIYISFAFALTMGFFFAIRNQRRLRKIQSVLEDLSRGNMTARCHFDRQDDDVGDIALNVDNMAEKIELLLSQARNLGANIAHDLRTPLARLRRHVESWEKLAVQNSEEIESVYQEIYYMQHIIDAIMRIARIESRIDKSKFQSIDLGVLVEDFYDIYAPVVEEVGKTLLLNIQMPAVINGDRDLLIQALANLCQNAIEYGGDNLTIDVYEASIEVYDNGQGIPEEALLDVVKPMVRLDQARTTGGAGLGLALVKAVAEFHSAKLFLSNRSLGGLCIKIIFLD